MIAEPDFEEAPDDEEREDDELASEESDDDDEAEDIELEVLDDELSGLFSTFDPAEHPKRLSDSNPENAIDAICASLQFI